MNKPEDQGEAPPNNVTPIHTVLHQGNEENEQIEMPFALHPSLLMQVMAMHRHFGIDYNGNPRMLSLEETEFRVAAFREEVQEYEDAGTLEEALDALVDLMVFALGAVERHGFMKFQEAFARVMTANMAKEVGNNPEKAEGRASWQADLVKPDGWMSADLSDLVLPAYGDGFLGGSDEEVEMVPFDGDGDAD